MRARLVRTRARRSEVRAGMECMHRALVARCETHGATHALAMAAGTQWTKASGTAAYGARLALSTPGRSLAACPSDIARAGDRRTRNAASALTALFVLACACSAVPTGPAAGRCFVAVSQAITSTLGPYSTTPHSSYIVRSSDRRIARRHARGSGRGGLRACQLMLHTAAKNDQECSTDSRLATRDVFGPGAGPTAR
jgi:hypothetical protein